MNTERLPSLFAEALELEGEERAQLLAAVERDDPALARELLRLLERARDAASPLDRPPWAALAEALAPFPEPERIGPYTILRELGHGGMGRVYLAEEVREAFRRTVALKLIERSPADADTLRRFRDEVRILAALDHPGIARLLDGGRSEEGVLFLALEYVEGADLVTHCRERRLAVPARIELFLTVLDAVGAAHAKGVVHRDLKPAHLRVGEDGRPRLLDFGISKLVEPGSGDEATVTRTEARAFTPAYASPEQFLGRPAGPASDIYSLGVVLYELVTGRRPFGDASSASSLLERVMLDRRAPPPSEVAAISTTGESTRTGSARIPRRHDLDAIVLKALAREPEARYASAVAMADDLRRYLDGRPVAARSERGRSRGGRVAVVALAVAALAATAWWAVVRSTPSATAARAAALRGDETIEQLEALLASRPTEVEIGIQLTEQLVHAGRTAEAELVLGRMRQIPGLGDDPRVEYAESVVATHLDQPQRALVHQTRALDAIAAGRHPELGARVRLGRSRALSDLGRRDEAHDELLRARAEAEASGDLETLAVALNDLAVDELTQGRLDEGRRLLEEALVPARRAAAASRVALILENLAGIDAVRGRPDLAEPRYRESAELNRRLGRRRRAAIAEGGLADALASLGRLPEAAEVRDHAIAELAELGDRTAHAQLLFARAAAAIESGGLGEAREDVETIAAAARASGNRVGLALATELEARLAVAEGDLAGARRSFAEAIRLFVADDYLDQAATAELDWASAELDGGELATAEAHLEAGLGHVEGGAGSVVALRAAALRLRLRAGRGSLAGAGEELARLVAAVEETTAREPRRALLAAAEDLARAARGVGDVALERLAGATVTHLARSGSGFESDRVAE